MAMTFVIGFIEGLFPESMEEIFGLVNTIINVPLSFGLVFAFLKLFNGEDVKAFDFATLGFSNFGKSWGVAFQMFLKMILPEIAVIVAFVIIMVGGVSMGLMAFSTQSSGASVFSMFMLLIGIILLVASIVWLITKSYYYQLAILVAIDNPDMSGADAVEESQRLMIQNNLIHEGERLDELQRNGYGIIQNPARFCFGMDAVLLSGFAKAKAGEKVLDLGTGTGIIPILMEAKTDAADFAALEIQEESADMARRSVAYNHLEDKIKVVTGDIRDASNIFGASSFHVITTNPPYMIGTHGENSPSTAKAIARHEVLCTLDDILRESARLLMPGGRFYMVHRPFRLAEIMSKMVEYKIEPKRMRLVYPYIDKEPNMVLIEGLRGGKSRVTVEKPLIVYKEQGVYTDEIYGIYGY